MSTFSMLFKYMEIKKQKTHIIHTHTHTHTNKQTYIYVYINKVYVRICVCNVCMFLYLYIKYIYLYKDVCIKIYVCIYNLEIIFTTIKLTTSLKHGDIEYS